MTIKFSAFVILIIFPCLGQSAPITFNTALPVSKGQYIFREQLILSRSSEDSSGLNSKLRENSAITTLAYGVTPNLSLFANLPFTNRNLENVTGTRSSSGIGDSRLFARFTIYQKDAKSTTFRFAPFVGVKIPTGNDNKFDILGKLPPNAQSGSGSWDTFGGGVLTYGTINWQIDTQLAYQKNDEANSIKLGDIAQADLSLQYRLLPKTITIETIGFLYGVLETNLIHKDKNRISGTTNHNTGGTILFAAPGIQYITIRWILESAIQIPIYQHQNGTALKNDSIFRVGFRMNF